MIRSTATRYFGQHTGTALAGWMTADAWTAIKHRQHVIKQHIPLIASARASHPFMLELLRIWRSMVSVFPRGSKWSKLARKLAGHTGRHLRMIWTWLRNTVIPDTLGNLRDYWQTRLLLVRQRHEMDAHMKKVFGADRTTNTGNIQDHAPPYQCDSTAEIASMIPLHRRARRLAKYRAVASFATPNEIHAMCLDGAEEAVEEFLRCGTPLPERMSWYAILESRMQKERRALQLLSDGVSGVQ